MTLSSAASAISHPVRDFQIQPDPGIPLRSRSVKRAVRRFALDASTIVPPIVQIGAAFTVITAVTPAMDVKLIIPVHVRIGMNDEYT